MGRFPADLESYISFVRNIPLSGVVCRYTEKSENMQEKRYLLSVKELLEDEAVLCRACEKLDTERLNRVQRMKQQKTKAQSVGAGLLLQYIVQEQLSGECHLGDEKEAAFKERQPLLTLCDVSEMIRQLETPIDLQYTYGTQGKPYFKELPYYFSLSHSGEYVFCAVSSREIGADIQQCKALQNHNLEKRFFADKERQLLEGGSSEERESLFYKLWTKKEAYGKLTGDGIGKAISIDVEALADKVIWEQYFLPKQYCIAVCRHGIEKNGK